MIYANVDENDRIEFNQALKDAKDKKWYRRLKVIDLSSLGYSVPELSNMFDLHAITIRGYIHRYNHGGLPELRPSYGQGRREILPWSKEQWLELINQAPCQFEKLETGAQNWTQVLMVDYLAAYHAVHVTQAAVSQMLKRVGVKWKRAKLPLPPQNGQFTLSDIEPTGMFRCVGPLNLSGATPRLSWWKALIQACRVMNV